MYLYPMGDDSENAINTNSLYKSAEVIDVDSLDYEDDESKEVLVENNLYKRISKQWLIAQEVARFSLFASSTSFLFLVFRSINWFPLVVSLFVLSFLVVIGVFSLAWNKLKVIDKVRLFTAGILTGLSAAVSSSDVIYLTFMSNQVIALSIGISVLVVITLIGILFGVLSYKRKIIRY